MKVFVSVGNATAGFERLLRTVDEALGLVGTVVEGVSQGGSSRTVPRGLKNCPFLSKAEFEREMESADVVICHAGVGTIRSALRMGHRPFVLPRLGSLGEHVNDHQLELFEALLREGLVRPVEDAESLARHIRDARPGLPSQEPSPEALEEVLQAFDSPPPVRRRACWVLWILSLGRDAKALEFRAQGRRDGP